MDLSDRLVEHDHWHTTRLLEQAATLSDEALDRHVRPGLIAHILTVSMIRRQTVIDVLRELGVPDVETRDPIERERAMATRS